MARRRRAAPLPGSSGEDLLDGELHTVDTLFFEGSSATAAKTGDINAV